MGENVPFSEANKLFKAPPGYEETIEPISAFNNGRCMVTAWKLSGDELAEIAATGIVYLSMISSPALVPHFIGSETTVRQVTADYGRGVWKKG
jgi:hypothetical protein